MLTVTVVIVSWNSGHVLRTCLEHLMQQTSIPDKVIVVDNASSDNSAEIVKSFSNVTLMQMDANLGFSAANNLAISVSQTDYVALLNPDAFPTSNWLESLMNAAESMPDIASFGSLQISDKNPNIIDGTGDAYHISGRVFRKKFGMRLQISDLVGYEIFSPCAAAALFKRKVLIESGGFDEDYFCYVEDIDLGFRLRLFGYKSIYVPEAVVHHVGSATTGGQHSDFSIYHGHRNLVWTFVKNMPGYLFWLLLPLHIILNLFSIVWFILRGNSVVILRAKRDALRGLPKTWCKRQTIQRSKVSTIRDIWIMLDKRM